MSTEWINWSKRARSKAKGGSYRSCPDLLTEDSDWPVGQQVGEMCQQVDLLVNEAKLTNRSGMSVNKWPIHKFQILTYWPSNSNNKNPCPLLITSRSASHSRHYLNCPHRPSPQCHYSRHPYLHYCCIHRQLHNLHPQVRCSRHIHPSYHLIVAIIIFIAKVLFMKMRFGDWRRRKIRTAQ